MAESKRSFVRMISKWPRRVLVEHIVSLRDQITAQAKEVGRLALALADQDTWHRARLDECRVAAAGMRHQIEELQAVADDASGADARAAAAQLGREQYEREIADLKAELDRRMREHQHALNEKDKCIVRLNGVADGLERAVAIAIGDGT